MSVKQKTLEVLEKHRGEYISGGELANALQVSRNAVWKAIKSLEQEGYEIYAVKNRGYQLATQNDILSEQSIRKYLTDENRTFQLEVRKSVTSTNALMKQKALEGEKQGAVLIAEEQTSGKEKSGGEFYSPKGTGIYMSILLKPDIAVEQSVSIAAAAAVAASQAIECVSEQRAEIMWINDIYCAGKKVGGILTEAQFSVETGKLDSVVVGVGVHVKMPQHQTTEIQKHQANCLFEQTETDVRSRIVAEFLVRFWRYFEDIEEKDFLKEYRERSCIIGKEIVINRKEGKKEGIVLEINDRCHAVVKWKDGTLEELCSEAMELK